MNCLFLLMQNGIRQYGTKVKEVIAILPLLPSSPSRFPAPTPFGPRPPIAKMQNSSPHSSTCSTITSTIPLHHSTAAFPCTSSFSQPGGISPHPPLPNIAIAPRASHSPLFTLLFPSSPSHPGPHTLPYPLSLP